MQTKVGAILIKRKKGLPVNYIFRKTFFMRILIPDYSLLLKYFMN